MSKKTRLFFVASMVVFLGLCSGPGMVRAQYFGQNKVEYKTFNFKIIKTEHFDVYYYPEERDAAEQSARMAERWYARYVKILDHELHGRQPLILYASHPDFEQTNAISGQLGEGTGGVTEPLRRRIVLPSGGPLAETNHVIGHELVHAFQFDITNEGQAQSVKIASPGVLRLPLWFIEGMAEFLSLGPIDPNTAMWMRDATNSKQKLPNYDQLENPEYFPYRYGQALWAYISGRWGDDAVGKLLKQAGRTGDAAGAIRKVLAVSPDTLVMDWHKATHNEYDPLLKLTKKPGDYGHEIVAGKENAAQLNVSPSLSPDGKKLVFFSSRSLFSIDMFLADAETGQIEKEITKTALDPHFQSLEFISSTGSWDPDGKRFVFGAVSGGHPLLSILSIKHGHIEQEIKLKDLDEVLNPSWSPDGNAIAFIGLVGGYTDLFVYDLKSRKLHRMTDDPYSDLQPAWSPDGQSIAFVSDRFSTNMSNLDIGNYRLARLDVNTGEIKPLPSFDDGKSINPQWSPDGTSLFFVSDHNGISNIYRLDLDSGAMQQITNLFTGVSGITGISPTISVALRASKLAYGVYENDKYSIYMIDSEDVLGIKEPLATDGEVEHMQPALLPPPDRKSTEVLSLLNNPQFGLESDTSFAITKYHAKLALDYIGQPYLAAGADRFGTYIAGGAALFFSDLLGDRNLVTAVQVTNNFNDFTALVGYQNTKHRWNWGGFVEQVPYITGSFNSGVTQINGEDAVVEQQLLVRQINREAAGLLAYPFNRVRRMEFSGGYRNITFSQELDTQAFSLNTGSRIVNEKNNLPSPSAINLFEASAALVYDNSFFGATSPILGQRYRFEVDPSLGSLVYFSGLADFRKYIMPLKPFTIAFRGLHYGRYGRDSEDVRLSPLFLGYPGLVRGYDFYSFSASECSGSTLGGCPVVDQLFGSRLLVTNLELRFPLYTLVTLGRGFFYGFLPIEIAAFYDAGVAWTSDDKAFFFSGGDRNLVSSVGMALRVNLGGYIVLEFDYVHPYDRPQKGWIWQFSFTPGF